MAWRSATALRRARCCPANSASLSAGTAVRQAASPAPKPAGNGAHVKQPPQFCVWQSKPDSVIARDNYLIGFDWIR